jgi:hypothetical protein
MREGLGGRWPEPRHLPSRRPSLSLGRRPCRACGASTPTPGVSSPYVWTLWRRCCDCCADRLLGSSTRSSVRGTWSTISSTSTRDFFRCAARLVVTIYDLLLASILGLCGSDASVAYPFPYRNCYMDLCVHGMFLCHYIKVSMLIRLAGEDELCKLQLVWSDLKKLGVCSANRSYTVVYNHIYVCAWA